MAECNSCRSAIRGETGICCEGVCKKVYHATNKCAGIDNYSAGILGKNNFVRFVCEDCMQLIQNIDMALKDILDDVKKSKHYLVEYKNEFNMSLKQNEREIKQLLQAVESRYEERIKKIDAVQSSCEKNIKEIQKVCGQVKEFENKNKEMCSFIEENNNKMCDVIKKAINETSVKQTKISFADTIKKTVVMPDLRKQMPVIVKPKEKQGGEKTREELNKKVDPVNLKIRNVESRKNGTVVIQTENEEEREKVKNAIQSEMSEGYDIKVPNPKEMKVNITDITFKYTENEIIEKIKKQNTGLSETKIKVVKIYEYKRNNKVVYNVKVATDGDTYTKLMNAQKINIGWERCRVFDGTDVIKCFKCKGFNHIARECKNDEICSKCHGNHQSNQCKKETITKCINCVRVNKKLNMGLDENHLTNNKHCPVYQNKLNIKRKKMGFTE